MPGKNLYLAIGPGLKKLLEPGRVCSSEKEHCGWIIIRKRRKQYYVYLQDEEKEHYICPLSRIQPVPLSLTLSVDGECLIVDVELQQPLTVETVIGAVKSLVVIAGLLPNLEKLLYEITAKYKLKEE